MKVDEFSGVGTYLLDSDGHRRSGRFATGNFINGFGAVQRGNEWSFRAQQACQQAWSAPDALTFLSDGRLHYQLREDRIAITYLNPSRAGQEQIVWLGNFDTLEPPVHNGTQAACFHQAISISFSAGVRPDHGTSVATHWAR
jgi:hypothetical protein